MAEISELQEAELKDLPTEDEILLLKKQWLEDCEEYHTELKHVSDLSRDYYKGRQTQLERLEHYESHAVENRLFLADETAIPIVTSRLPEVQITPPTFDELSVKMANDLEKVMDYHMEETEVQRKSEISVRSLSHNRYYIWHVYWDTEKQDVNFRIVPTKNCWFPRHAANGLPYMMELMEFNAYDLVEQFGKKALQEAMKDVSDLVSIGATYGTKGSYYIWALWTKQWVAWVGKNGVIKREKNPTWDWDIPEKNHFIAPKIPYIIGTAFEDGEETVGITSLYEQTIPPQDTVNKVYRHMVDYMETVGNPQVRIDSQAMSREEAEQITNEQGIKIYGKGVANENMVRRDSPPPMPNYIPNLLQIAQAQTDNIYGTHSTTRGERGEQKTLGEAQMLKESDQGRLDLLGRVLGRSINELGNWYIQFMSMYYDEKRDIPVLDATEELMFVEGFSNAMIQRGVKFRTKLGSSLPDDKEARANLFLQLAKANMVRPLDLYKALDLPDPQTLEDNLIKWQSGVLQQQAMMQVAPPGVPSGAPPMPGAPPPVPQPPIGPAGGLPPQ